MVENVKNKDAEAADPAAKSELDEGLQDTFPASDPIAPLQPGSTKDEDEAKG